MNRELCLEYKSKSKLFTNFNSTSDDETVNFNKLKQISEDSKSSTVKRVTKRIGNLDQFLATIRRRSKINSIIQFIEYRKTTEIILETIPQLILQFYLRIFASNWNMRDVTRMIFGIFGCIIAPYSFASYVVLCYKLKGIKMKSWFIALRTLTNYLFFTTRLLSIVMCLFISKWLPFLIFFLHICIHFIYFYRFIAKKKREKAASILFISILKSVSFCEDIDLSFYCVLNHSIIWIENVLMSMMFHLNEFKFENSYFNLMKTILPFYVVIALVIGFLVELSMKKFIFETKVLKVKNENDLKEIILNCNYSIFLYLFNYDLDGTK